RGVLRSVRAVLFATGFEEHPSATRGGTLLSASRETQAPLLRSHTRTPGRPADSAIHHQSCGLLGMLRKSARMPQQCLVVGFDGPVAFADRLLHGLKIGDLNSAS